MFQFEPSTDHRADVPQVKINLSALDPLGLPLTTTVVSGNGADDPLYVPEIRRVQQTVEAGGKTSIGACTMGALSTRAWIASSGDYDLCPLAGKPLPAATLDALLAPVLRGEHALEPVYDPEADPTDPPELIAEGYAVAVELEDTVEGQRVAWRERHRVVRSVALAQQQARRLDERIQQTLTEIGQLNARKQGKKIPPVNFPVIGTVGQAGKINITY
ncbi:MAG: hypothetical protein IPL99_25580 [Candidatus Competibacteraceae bacterium]|nr:hypothetical protein [Candidatus Competibacteraceae bacterium]